MQKWLPDEFQAGSSFSAAVLPEESGVFESENLGTDTLHNDNQRLFLSESGFSGPEAIMGHLTREERAQVFELVEQDIKKEYEDRETALRAELESDLNEARKDFDDVLASWTEKLHQAMASHMKEMADSAARLAVQLSEKIVRRKVDLDHEILVRAMETTLFKMDGDKSVTINVNPQQAEWLEKQSGVKEKLGIQQIISDRRIDPGGCLIKTEKQEWDVTVSGQLNYLSEIVEEMITTADEPDLLGEDGKDAELSVD